MHLTAAAAMAILLPIGNKPKSDSQVRPLNAVLAAIARERRQSGGSG
jgi:hypothetical protein